MAKTYMQDMTKGNITNHLLKFAVPLLLGNIFQQFYNMVDSIVVGRYVGADALGSVGSVGSLVFLFFSLCLGLANGIGILVSQFFGAGKAETTKEYIGQAIFVTLAAGIAMSLLGGLFAHPILKLMNTPAENMADALLYMRIVCGCMFINAIYNTVSAVLRALGDSRTPLIFLVVASVINIVLDLIFVIAFDWGVAGVAWATVIAQGISAAGSILWGVKTNPYMRIHISNLRVQKDIIRREVRMGLPLAAQSATIAISCVALQSVVNGFGSMVMAAYTTSNRIEQIVQQPFNSLGLALATFAGQNFGAGNKDRIKKAAIKGNIMNVIFSVVMVIVMFTLGKYIVAIFCEEAEVIAIGTKGLQLTSTMYVFLGIIYVMRGLLNGVGDVTFSMMNGISEVICRIGFSLGMVYLLGFDYMAVWYTNGFTWVLVGIMSVIRFYKGSWINKEF